MSGPLRSWFWDGIRECGAWAATSESVGEVVEEAVEEVVEEV